MPKETPYIVSARKYRPSSFKSVVGQKYLTSTLKNAITEKRLAQAYLFCGPRGVGKTSCARIFAKSINCLNPTPEGDACCQCESCLSIDRGNSFNLVELDAASNNSVDDIRSITDQVHVPPQDGRYRVFIIDEVHMLSNSAFNAFLKTLEEPPANVIFILATTEKHKVIPTILSRCQIYDFKRITIDDMVDHLAYVAENEKVKAEREALAVIAHKADGAMRDALSIFDQVAASTRGEVTYANTIDNLNVLDYDYYFRLIDDFRNGDVIDALLIYKDIRDKGFDSLFFINGLASHIRDLMVAADPRTVKLLETSEEVGKRYHEQSRSLPYEWYFKALDILNDCDVNYRTSTNKRLLVELTLMKLCNLMNPGALSPQSPKADLPKVSPVPPSVKVDPPAVSQSSAPSLSEEEKIRISKKAEERKTESPRQGFSKIRPASVRINAAPKSESEKSEKKEHLNFPVTEENIVKAWGEFLKMHPDMHILANAMRTAKPERMDETNFSVILDHPAQVQAFELAKVNLVQYLREKLGNENLTLHISLNQVPEADARVHPKEMLRKIVSENPAMAKFLKEIDGELIG